MKNITLKQKQGGFTLLELLVVVAILAIIAGAVISAISGQEERAGQGVTLHTMGALENVTRQHNVLFRGLPNSLDSLYCADVEDADLATAEDTSGIAATIAEFGGTSDAPFEDGGLTLGLREGLALVALPDAALTALNDAGISEVRVVHTDYCNQTPEEGDLTIDGALVEADDDLELAQSNSSYMFLTPAESELGRANIVPLSNGNTADSTQLFVHQDPGDIGAAADDIVVVLGIGNKSSLVTNNLIGRAPRDGNAPGAHYANFSLALKIGELGGTDTLAAITGDSDFDDGVSLVAILDSDGDFFDEEVAEFTGLQDE